MPLVAQSLLSADFTNIAREVEKLESAGVDLFHLDVMDGHFVPNLTYGPMFVAAVRKLTQLPLDVHLMVERPEKMVPWFADAGADTITFHLEASKNPAETLKLIRSLGKKAGLSIKQRTKPEKLEPYLADLDQILIMSIEPGFGGQAFLPRSLEKIEKTKEIIGKKPILIEVDGGINPQNAKNIAEAGADILVAGSAVFKNPNYAETIRLLKS